MLGSKNLRIKGCENNLQMKGIYRQPLQVGKKYTNNNKEINTPYTQPVLAPKFH
jgi:hypothetical protein